MLPVACKPVVQYVVEEMVDQGLTRFLFITGRDKRSVEDHFDRDPELLRSSFGKRKPGTAGRGGLWTGGGEVFLHPPAYPAGTAYAARNRRRHRRCRGLRGRRSVRRGAGRHHCEVRQPRRVDPKDDQFPLPPRFPLHPSLLWKWILRMCPTTVLSIPRAGPVRTSKSRGIVEKPAVADAPSRLAVAARYVFHPEIFDAIRHTLPGPEPANWS